MREVQSSNPTNLAWNYTSRLGPMANPQVILCLTVSLDKGLLYPPRVVRELCQLWVDLAAVRYA